MQFPNIDVGPQVLRDIYQAMSIDPEWSVWSDRQFTWWGWKFSQTIRASQPYKSANHTVTNIVAVTDFLSNVPDTSHTHSVITALNGLASMSAVLWDPIQRKVRLGCSAIFHAGNAPWLTKVFYTAAAIQAAEATTRAETFAKLLQCTPDWSAHPVNGFRETPDDLMRIHEFLFSQHSDRSLYKEEDLQEAVEALREYGVTSFGSGSELSAEFVFFGDRTVAELILENPQATYKYSLGSSELKADRYGPETALLRVNCDIEHPLVGKGVLLLLRLPVNGEIYDPSTYLFVHELNYCSVYSSELLSHLLGGWSIDPVLKCVTCVSFLPSNIAYPGMIKIMCLNEGLKTSWALECYRKMKNA